MDGNSPERKAKLLCMVCQRPLARRDVTPISTGGWIWRWRCARDVRNANAALSPTAPLSFAVTSARSVTNAPRKWDTDALIAVANWWRGRAEFRHSGPRRPAVHALNESSRGVGSVVTGSAQDPALARAPCR